MDPTLVVMTPPGKVEGGREGRERREGRGGVSLMVSLMSLPFCFVVRFVRCGQEVGGASWTQCLEIVILHNRDTYSASSTLAY